MGISLSFASDGQEHSVGAASVGGNAGQKRAFDAAAAAENSDDNDSDAEVESAGEGAGAGAPSPSTAGGPEGTYRKNNNKMKRRRRRKDGCTGATSAL